MERAKCCKSLPSSRRKDKDEEEIPSKKTVAPLEPWNFHWIVDERLATMGCLTSEGHVNYILGQGIAHLISLSPEKQPPFEFFPKYFRWTPIDVLEFEPPTVQQIITFINICEEAKKLKEAVGVHCRMGRGRCGVFAACYLVRFRRMHPDKAVMKVRLMVRGAIETYYQEKAVWAYYDHIKRIRTPSPDLETYMVNLEIPPYKTVLHKYYPELEANPFIKHPYEYYFGGQSQPFEYLV